MSMDARAARGPKCIALVGPYQSGKTSLLEAVLARAGAIQRVGTVDARSSVGDASPEARAHQMSVEPNIATIDFLGDKLTFIDCPGSVEFLQDMRAALPAIDAAIVVCEADAKKAPSLQMILRMLEDQDIPRFLFLNKIDKAEARVRDILDVLQPASRTPLLLRQIPIWQNGIAIGFIDLALERAYIYREHAPSQVSDFPDDHRAREKEARFRMLERLSDYDDSLLEQLLEDIEPPRDQVFADLTAELREGQIVPVLLGSALHGNGVLRLLKALRHDAPGVEATARRNGIAPDGDAYAFILKTIHTPHGGKLSVARVLSGVFDDSATVTSSSGASERAGGLLRLTGAATAKVEHAGPGDTVAFARLEQAMTGDGLAVGEKAPVRLSVMAPPPPVMALALAPSERKDEVKLAGCLAKLADEDPSYVVKHNPEASELILRGQGEMHLRVALERLTGRYGVDVNAGAPRVAYRETIRKSVTVRGRHRKQSGGHGQFGDVVVDIAPLGRGEGFRFDEKITGGVVPKQFFSSIEKGVRDALVSGPLGFPVIDLSVTLIDGSYHSVDSSDAAFQAAARLAMVEGLPQCDPVLLEPVSRVDIIIPSTATARVTAIISQRRGQILGFSARPDWDGWDIVQALLPEAELGGLIVEIRSASAGAGTFTAEFDHLAELHGRLADQVVSSRQAAE